jgi:hypothetical protein
MRSNAVTDGLVMYHRFLQGGKIPVGSGSAYFDGSSYIQLSISFSYTSFSISFWLNYSYTGAAGRVFSAADSATDGINIGVVSSTVVRCTIDSTNCNLSGLTEGEWYHIAYTYDGTNIRGYVDGVLATTTALTTTVSTTAAARIGVRSYTSLTNYLDNSFLSQLTLWTRTLTQEEINKLRFATYSTNTVSTTSLYSWFELDNITSVNAPDSTGLEAGTIV